MNIAIIADDKRKELMVQFCIAYCGILSKHRLCATATTGKLVADVTGLEIARLMSGERGGMQQLANKIAYDEIAMVLFFRDPMAQKENARDDLNLLRLCDMHNIPLATNIATGEILVRALTTDALDWRDPHGSASEEY